MIWVAFAFSKLNSSALTVVMRSSVDSVYVETDGCSMIDNAFIALMLLAIVAATIIDGAFVGATLRCDHRDICQVCS